MTACTSCGQNNAPDAQFCVECGEYLGWASGGPPAAETTTDDWFDEPAPRDTPAPPKPAAPTPTAHPTAPPPAPPAAAPAGRPADRVRSPPRPPVEQARPVPAAPAERSRPQPEQPRRVPDPVPPRGNNVPPTAPPPRTQTAPDRAPTARCPGATAAPRPRGTEAGVPAPSRTGRAALRPRARRPRPRRGPALADARIAPTSATTSTRRASGSPRRCSPSPSSGSSSAARARWSTRCCGRTSARSMRTSSPPSRRSCATARRPRSSPLPTDGRGGAPQELSRQLAEAVSELGPDCGRAPRPSRSGLPHRLLRTGLCLRRHPRRRRTRLRARRRHPRRARPRPGLVFVTDAAQELTAPEVEFLTQALERCPTAACVVTKTDLHQHWRRIVELDAATWNGPDIDLPVFAVSSYLRLRAWRPPELDRGVGLPPAVRLAARRRREAAASTPRHRTAALDVQLRRRRSCGRRSWPSSGRRPAAGVRAGGRPPAAPVRRTGQLVDARHATWQQVLGDGVDDLVADVKHDLRGRIRDVALRGRGRRRPGRPAGDLAGRRGVAARAEVAAAMVTSTNA